MRKVGILGASGFIGSRTVDVLHSSQQYQVYPIVRKTSSVERLTQFGLKPRQADALDANALTLAFANCDTIIHSVIGSPSLLRKTVMATYQAAERATVRRIIYLSSGSVHSQTPQPGTHDGSPLNDRQPIAYNNAKAQAEQILQQLRRQGNTEVVILRPTIVFGPGSGWVQGFADQVLAGSAYLVNHGEGICNSIFIDNLIHAMQLAIAAPAADVDGEAFLVGDRERVTWADLYRPIATALGKDFAAIPSASVPYVDGATLQLSRKRQLLETLRNSDLLERLTAVVPRRVIAAVKERMKRSLSSSTSTSNPTIPSVTPENALLFLSQYQLPYTKASQRLGYEPIVSFVEGRDRAISWLAALGYPINQE